MSRMQYTKVTGLPLRAAIKIRRFSKLKPSLWHAKALKYLLLSQKLIPDPTIFSSKIITFLGLQNNNGRASSTSVDLMNDHLRPHFQVF